MKNTILAAVTLGMAALTVGVSAQGTPLPPPLPSKSMDLEQPLLRIAMGSCFAPQLEDHSIWGAIEALAPDLFLYLGDNVYQSKEIPDADLPFLKEGYGFLAASKPFASLRASTPVMVTWDDHDYGMNDAGASWVAREQAEDLHEHVWGEGHDDPRLARDGVYYARTFGPTGQRVQVIMLDTRFFRSDLEPSEDKEKYGKYAPSNDPDKTMLGSEQWAWLEAQFREPADLRLVVSSVVLVQTEHTMEGWRTLPSERQRFFDLIEQTDANGVVVLAGDRHFSGFYEDKESGPYPVTEIMSSSMNLPVSGPAAERFQKEAEPHKIGESYMQASFTSLDIDWVGKKVTAHIRSATGDIVRSHTVNFGALTK